MLLRPVGDADKWPVLHQHLPRMDRPRLPRHGPDPLHLGTPIQAVTVRMVFPLTLCQARLVLADRAEYA